MDLQQDQLILAVGSAIIGGIISFLVTKIVAKSSLLTYTVNTERVALSNQEPVFGTVQVTWQNNPVTNLFLSLVEIENASARDFTNIVFKAYANDDVFMLSANAIIVDSTYIPRLTERYSEAIRIEPGVPPTPLQIANYFHEKEYVCDVLNRGQKAQIHLLSTCRTQPFQPDIFIDTQHPGVKLKRRATQALIHGVPTMTAIRFGLVTSLVVVALIGFYVTSVWFAVIVSILVGLFAQSIGALLYRLYRKVRILISM
jgi:hypothetical protein